MKHSHPPALLGQVGDTDIRLLRVFRSVVDCGGMAAAELELNVGRSTISRHVKDLEERLGLVLCRRGRSGFQLTDEGRRVYEDTLRLMESLDAFRANVGQMHGELAGTLQIGLFDKMVTNPVSRVDRAIRAFTQAAPQVTLSITVGALNTIEPAIMDGQMQVAIVPDHRRSQSLDYLPLFDEQMRLYMGSEHPLFGRRRGAQIPADDIRACAFAGLAFHSPNMEATRRLGLKRTATATDQEAIALLILSGSHLGFLPEHYAAQFVEQGLMRPANAAGMRYDVQFVAITRRAATPSRLTQAFVEALRAAHSG
ncbi:LysR family transcriptional regulator [Variovorax sp. VNK109]|jgi:DNA-binding transcriptional LysR family regulator|uniref:LysR family transcriptional regulator n=1 Tax=Variovorax sp. VNK109 TaxID=3400919 RepID=UPI003BFEF801